MCQTAVEGSWDGGGAAAGATALRRPAGSGGASAKAEAAARRDGAQAATGARTLTSWPRAALFAAVSSEDHVCAERSEHEVNAESLANRK